MSEKKAKEARRAEKVLADEVIAEFHIRAFANGAIKIVGPINNFLLFRDIMNSAERAVLTEIQKQITKDANEPRIIVPNMAPPKGNPSIN